MRQACTDLAKSPTSLTRETRTLLRDNDGWFGRRAERSGTTPGNPSVFPWHRRKPGPGHGPGALAEMPRLSGGLCRDRDRPRGLGLGRGIPSDDARHPLYWGADVLRDESVPEFPG